MKLNKFIALFFIISILSITGLKADDYAVVDYQKALQDSKAFKSFQSQAQKIGDDTSKQFAAERQKLEKDRSDLISNSSDFSKNELQKRKEDLDKRVESFTKKYQTKQQNFDKIAADAVASIESQAKKVIASYAKEKNYSMIYQAAALAYFPPEKDITADITKRLNSSLPSVTVKQP